MNEAAFSNCNAEDYINIDEDVQTEPDTMDIDALFQNFRERQKEREQEEEEEEEENDISNTAGSTTITDYIYTTIKQAWPTGKGSRSMAVLPQ